MRFSLRTIGVHGALVTTLLATAMHEASAQTPGDGSWKSLMDGRSANAWRGYQATVLPAGWHVRDGTLAKDGPAADLITREQFANFELELEWKIAPGGNAGIFYRATEDFERVYWTGPEYQILDDASAPDARNRLTSAGAAYALYPSPPGLVKPAGEWNATRIVVNGAHVEHWLNGKKLLEYELWSPDWEAKVRATKFAEWPRYGREKTGHIGIQGDHEGALALRNIRIKVLP
ncbi:MAG: DUF1080 domain-containing protein [Gemmatimonadaceae bacterium]